MILLAESGTSKTHWYFSNGTDIFTQGINPYYISEHELTKILESSFSNLSKAPTKVLFFGAGCNSDHKNLIIKRAINNIWTEADVEVFSDILASCIATSYKRESICCILGTGSNSCYFDGERIVSAVPSLGYILGDEASGANLGRELINFLYKRCDDKLLINSFEEKYKLGINDIQKRVYNDSFPSKFLSDFVPFILDNISNKYICNIVTEAFSCFIERNILRYENHTSIPINFTGSVAYLFSDLLQNELSKHSLKLGSIVRYPIHGLKKVYCESLL